MGTRAKFKILPPQQIAEGLKVDKFQLQLVLCQPELGSSSGNSKIDKKNTNIRGTVALCKKCINRGRSVGNEGESMQSSMLRNLRFREQPIRFVASFVANVAAKYEIIVSYKGIQLNECPIEVVVSEGWYFPLFLLFSSTVISDLILPINSGDRCKQMHCVW